MTEEINDTPTDENETQPIVTDSIAADPIERVEHLEVKEVPETIIFIGELLRSKREEKGLNLKAISQQTKVHMGLLEHLENNDLAKLPSKTYVRGFVKSAAKILGINQEVALNSLEATYNRNNKNIKKEIPNYEMRNETARNTLTSMVATPLETVKSVTASSVAFLAKVVVGILIFGVIGFNIKNLIDRSAEERLKLPQVLSTIHQKLKAAPKTAPTKTIVKQDDNLAAQLNPIKVNIIQDKKDSSQKSEITINDVVLKTISLGEKQFSEDDSIPENKMEEIFPSRYKVRVTKGIENVFINAVDGDSWITYKVDDKEIKKYVLRQGRSVFLRGEKIRLFVGNTKSIKIFYNNKLIALNAKSAVKNIVFPEDIKTKYMSPLFVFQKDGTVVTSEDYIKLNQKDHPTIVAPVTPATKNGVTAPSPKQPVAPTLPVNLPVKKL
ncbi:MAG: helix-turn-helix transcriptional regulator [Bacteriovorax sp.]|nr:helix-turn-helix transcriptional regulator [Bacteriovorax sp.]